MMTFEPADRIGVRTGAGQKETRIQGDCVLIFAIRACWILGRALEFE